MIPFLSCAKSLLFWVIKHFVHADFREHFQRMKPLDRLLFLRCIAANQNFLIKGHHKVFLSTSYIYWSDSFKKKINTFIFKNPINSCDRVVNRPSWLLLVPRERCIIDFDSYFVQIIHGLDRSGMEWHRFPVFLGLAYLLARRHLHYHYTLLNVGKNQAGERFNPAEFPYRTANGKFNDPSNEDAGSIESFFGRNIAPLDCRKGVYNYKIL
ncbi:hypothetical protein HanPI659440_Chr00c04g0712611 [Helianthus annuus]|nr:hypothetical protein HanPI659440_Chr00c04g0712611 [Helianthus annuus]